MEKHVFDKKENEVTISDQMFQHSSHIRKGHTKANFHLYKCHFCGKFGQIKLFVLDCMVIQYILLILEIIIKGIKHTKMKKRNDITSLVTCTSTGNSSEVVNCLFYCSTFKNEGIKEYRYNYEILNLMLPIANRIKWNQMDRFN